MMLSIAGNCPMDQERKKKEKNVGEMAETEKNGGYGDRTEAR